ncbi:hypothetical protein N9C48_00520 [bacterium]|nr:hypothetical protein [bacterium]
MALRLRRGTDAQRLTLDGVSIPVPAEGEIIYTTDTKKLYVGDGTTVGGVAVDVANSDLNIDDLSDVDTTSVGHIPNDGEALVWDQGMSHWMPGDATILSDKSINALQDVDTISNTPTVGQVLKYDGAGWVNGTDVSGGLIDGATYPINITGDVTGSVFGDDSTQIVDGTDGTITTPAITVDIIDSKLADGPVTVKNDHRTPLRVKAVTTGTQGGYPYLDINSVKGSFDNPIGIATGEVAGAWKISGYIDETTDASATVGVGSFASTATMTDDNPESVFTLITGGGGTSFNLFNFDHTGQFIAPGAITPGVYADDAARDAAIPTPTAGMMVFNTTGTKFQGYTGSAWVDLN